MAGSHKVFAFLGIHGQYSTWLEHSTFAAHFPWVVALIARRLIGLDVFLGALIASVLTLAFFAVREWRQLLKDPRETWDDPYRHTPNGHLMDRWTDMMGDLLGPVSVTHVYLIAYLLSAFA